VHYTVFDDIKDEMKEMYSGASSKASFELMKKLEEGKNLLNSMGDKVEIPNDVSIKCVRSLMPR
jgi:hypothetical protein